MSQDHLIFNIQNMKNNFLLFSVFSVFLLIIRVLLNNSPDLVFIVSLINLIALLLVIVSIRSQIQRKLFDIVDRSGVPHEIVEREKRNIQKSVNCLIFIPFFIVAFLYLCFLSSELGNDIVAIIALGLSLCDNDLVDIVIKLYKH